MATLPYASLAVTVIGMGTPVVAVVGTATLKKLADPGLTAIAPLVPVRLGRMVSRAVIVQGAPKAVLSVTTKLPTPLVSVALGGRTAFASVLVNWTVPE